MVVVEHRQGAIRDITFEMLAKGEELCRQLSLKLTAVLIGWELEPFLEKLSRRADTVLIVEREELKHYDSRLVGEVLNQLIQEEHPFLTLIGQTSWGLDLAPALAVKTDLPLATDCLDILVDKDSVSALRTHYSGKALVKVSFKKAGGYLATLRPGAFPAEKGTDHAGEILKKDLSVDWSRPGRRFVEFQETGAGDIDITQAEFLVSVGRGVGEEENLAVVRDLARNLGAVLSCSRPIVDKKWLPKYHQVGTSGKSVKPKVYLALGISGAFQHVAGISGAGTVIAINRDPKAPIFRVADYGVVGDIFKIIPAIKEKLQ
jgi:electron transfer flavoprotein alpha subunit